MIQTFSWKTPKEKQFMRPEHRRDDNVKMKLQKYFVRWIELAQHPAI